MIGEGWTHLRRPHNSQEVIDFLSGRSSSLSWIFLSSVFSYTLWAIWKARNALIKEGGASSPGMVARAAMASAEEFFYTYPGQPSRAGFPGPLTVPVSNLSRSSPPR